MHDRKVTPARGSGDVSNIRVVIVDDHEILRQSLVRLLEQEKDILLVGQAADGMSAVNLSQRLKPDVIVMDVNMPGINGIESTRLIKSHLPDARVIGLSMQGDSTTSAKMLEAGACGYVCKDAPYEELIAAIRGG